MPAPTLLLAVVFLTLKAEADGRSEEQGPLAADVSAKTEDALAATLLGLPTGPFTGVAGTPTVLLAGVLTSYGDLGGPGRLPLWGGAPRCPPHAIAGTALYRPIQ